MVEEVNTLILGEASTLNTIRLLRSQKDRLSKTKSVQLTQGRHYNARRKHCIRRYFVLGMR